ncbi:MAG TPA: hypothetical protein VM942_03180 [Acidimicrobiales bacterium]|nr:hypothetical protein [Acidimicrobiales bacterium]
MADEDESLEKLQQDPATWSLDQELDVAAEVYDPKRRNIHEMEGEDMLDRFRTLLGFDVSWDQPPTPTPPPDEEA